MLVKAKMLAGRAMLWVVRRCSRAVSREVRVAMDMAKSELMLDREKESLACSRRKVPMEPSFLPNVLRWRVVVEGSGCIGACWAEGLLLFLTGGRT